jgi:hypothetical protein
LKLFFPALPSLISYFNSDFSYFVITSFNVKFEYYIAKDMGAEGANFVKELTKDLSKLFMIVSSRISFISFNEGSAMRRFSSPTRDHRERMQGGTSTNVYFTISDCVNNPNNPNDPNTCSNLNVKLFQLKQSVLSSGAAFRTALLQSNFYQTSQFLNLIQANTLVTQVYTPAPTAAPSAAANPTTPPESRAGTSSDNSAVIGAIVTAALCVVFIALGFLMYRCRLFEMPCFNKGNETGTADTSDELAGGKGVEMQSRGNRSTQKGMPHSHRQQRHKRSKKPRREGIWEENEEEYDDGLINVQTARPTHVDLNYEWEDDEEDVDIRIAEIVKDGNTAGKEWQDDTGSDDDSRFDVEWDIEDTEGGIEGRKEGERRKDTVDIEETAEDVANSLGINTIPPPTKGGPLSSQSRAAAANRWVR